MKKIYIISIVLMLIPFTLFGRSSASIKGHVLSKETSEHLPYVSITIKGTQISTLTDESGHFHLNNVPTGNHELEANFMGFEKQSVKKQIYVGQNTVNFSLSEDTNLMDELVIETSAKGSLRKSSPGLVSLISKDIFINTNANTLSQSLDFQPGLRMETTCQNCGSQQVRINGLDGSYSLIMIDGLATMSSLTSVYGLEQIPANMIERVEISRGGGSAISGPTAIGGTINIITKESYENSVSLSNNTNFIGGKSADINSFLNASVVSKNKKAGAFVFGSIRKRNPYDADGDGFTEIGVLEGKTIGTRAFFEPSERSKISLEYHNIYEHRRGGDSLDLMPHYSNITEMLDHEIHGATLRYTINTKDRRHFFNVYTSGQYAKRNSYFGTGQNPDGYGNALDKVFIGGGNYKYLFNKLFFMPSELTIGAEYNYNSLEDIIPSFDRNLQQTVHTESFYMQNEWKTDELSLLIGGRIDNHNLLSKPVISPRANIKYNPISNLTLRGTYSQGFRAPQVYNEDLHVSIADGEPVIIKIDPNLKKEDSHSFSLSANYNKDINDVKIDLLLEGFYTKLNNSFMLENIGSDDLGNTVLLRRNSSGAVVRGLNLELTVTPHKNINIQGGYTLQSAEYKDAQKWSDDDDVPTEKRMFRSPNNYAYLITTYNPHSNVTFALSGTYTGSMLIDHKTGFIDSDIAVKTPTFFDMGFKASYNIMVAQTFNIEFSASVQNIFDAYQKDFDRGANRDSDYIYGPSLPQGFGFGCKIEF